MDGRKHLAALLLCGLASLSVRGQDRLVEPRPEGIRQLFYDARDSFHTTWLEQGHDRFRELLDSAPDLAIGHAYSALNEKLLYQNVSEQVKKARELPCVAETGECTMVQALTAYAEGNVAGCETALAEYLQTFVEDPYAWHLLAIVQSDLGRPQEAAATLERLTQSDFAPAWNHLGYARLALNDPTAALVAFERFMKIAPANPSAYDSAAEALVRLGRRDEAIAHMTRATLLESRFAYGWLHMGRILEMDGSALAAHRAYQRALETAILYGSDFRKMVNDTMAAQRGR